MAIAANRLLLELIGGQKPKDGMLRTLLVSKMELLYDNLFLEFKDEQEAQAMRESLDSTASALGMFFTSEPLYLDMARAMRLSKAAQGFEELFV